MIGARTAHPVPNGRGGVLPCCYKDCERPGDNGHRVMVDHDTPSWRDQKTGRCEQLVYVFCGDGHRSLWLAEFRANHAGTAQITGPGRSGLVSPFGLPL